MNIAFQQEKKFDGLIFTNPLRFDIYIESHNLIIEYDGQFHFKTTNWNSLEALAKIKTRDIVKDLFCLRSRINICRIPYTEDFDEETIKYVLELCQNEKKLYKTYSEYIETTKQFFDVDSANCIVMQDV
jgi:hypothetical protein